MFMFIPVEIVSICAAPRPALQPQSKVLAPDIWCSADLAGEGVQINLLSSPIN